MSSTWPAPAEPVTGCVMVDPASRDVEHVLAGFFDPFLDREPGLLGLAVAEPDAAVAVAHDHEGGEREAAAALYDLGDPVDPDRPLFELTVQHRQSSSPSFRAASARAATRPW